jgi:error-prone DNA polymerase
MTYAELQVTTHFSFLRGASSPKELFTAAANLGIGALGIVDRNSVAGMVQAWEAAKATGVRLVPGCRLDLVSGESLLVYPGDRQAWSRMTRLLSSGRPQQQVNGKWLGKSECILDWEAVAAHSEGLVAALVADEADEKTAKALGCFRDIFGDRSYCALSYRRRPGDRVRINRLDEMARAAGVRPLATGEVLYHSPDRRMLGDVVTAIREKCTIDELGFRRELYADRHLKSAAEMERLFRYWPHMIAASSEIVARCDFDLSQLCYQYPEEAVLPGMTAQQALEKLTWEGARRRYPEGIPQEVSKQLGHELGLIGRCRYAPYFLTVNSIVQFARSQKILCQGRGSAANSAVCYVLGITAIDPTKFQLLFERFISEERREPPDIDVDFEHERREEVIQWIYNTYGRHRAALTAVVSRYRSRGSVRDVGKALGLPEDVTGALAGQIWGWSQEGVSDRHVAELNLDGSDPRLALTLHLARELIGTPRHLSQHPGGFVLTQDRLDELVPIQPAAMLDRRVIEWEKDDIEALGFMKVDVLGVGMLGCMRRAFDLLRNEKSIDTDLAGIPLDDRPTYEMIQRADTLGVFQIESRAQMSMLPRMKPKELYDLVIEVAIVRPGPIQGDMVHPYLRRREGKEAVDYPSPQLRAILEKTLGVPLFQEQAMNVAIVGAGFTPGEADALRRSMATFKFTGGVGEFRDKLINGMIANGYQRDFAERTFKQIEGFGSYGFPESHAASFALIAYASSWMKCHHPDIFCAALLNAQPMGFYAPAQIVRDAREHGVEVRPVCINRSEWDCTLEAGEGDGAFLPLRLGMRMTSGLSIKEADKIIAARASAVFLSIEDAWRRSGVPRAALEKLANADAFHALGLSRRQALWQVRGLRDAPLPLFAAADLREAAREPQVALNPMTEGREVVEDYRHTQLSLRAHPLTFLRPELERRGIVSCRHLERVKDGRKIEVAGIILVRQRPGSTNVTFITIEDETGIANAILWQRTFEAQRRIVMSSAMISVKGTVQREGGVIHVIADRIEDYTPLLHSIGEMHFPHRPGPGDGVTHPGSPDPRGDWKKRVRDHYYPPFRTGADLEASIRQKTRDFH